MERWMLLVRSKFSAQAWEERESLGTVMCGRWVVPSWAGSLNAAGCRGSSARSNAARATAAPQELQNVMRGVADGLRHMQYIRNIIS